MIGTKPGEDAVNTAPGSLSIVVPAFNEEEVLRSFHDRLCGALRQLANPIEIIYVNDGSRDRTLELLYSLRDEDPRVVVIDLSRNFGKEIAMTAGMDFANGDGLVIIDADLQDPPELIPKLVQTWNEGHDVVYARRTSRLGETRLKKATAAGFYRTMQHFGQVRIPEDTGDFRLMSKRAVEAVCAMREQHRFMKGLYAWVGFRQTAIPYERDPRFAGQTKWNYWRLWNFSLEGFTSFTIAPLKAASYLGVMFALAAFVYGLIIVAKTLLYGDPVAGYPSLMTVVLVLGGVQLIALGIIGEYLGRVFNETKQRPLYFLQDLAPAREPLADGGETRCDLRTPSA